MVSEEIGSERFGSATTTVATVATVAMASRSRAPAVLLAAVALSLGSAFAGCGGARRELRRLPRAADNFLALDAVEPAVTSYASQLHQWTLVGLHFYTWTSVMTSQSFPKSFQFLLDFYFLKFV